MGQVSGVTRAAQSKLCVPLPALPFCRSSVTGTAAEENYFDLAPAVLFSPYQLPRSLTQREDA